MVRIALEESHKIYANGSSKEDEDLQRALMASQTISDVDGQSFDDDMKRGLWGVTFTWYIFAFISAVFCLHCIKGKV